MSGTGRHSEHNEEKFMYVNKWCSVQEFSSAVTLHHCVCANGRSNKHRSRVLCNKICKYQRSKVKRMTMTKAASSKILKCYNYLPHPLL